jgi:uncharacterized membrane protein YfcA
VPLLTLAAPLTSVVPLVACLDYIGSASQGLKNRDQIVWGEQLVLLPFMVVGIATGLVLLRSVATGMLAKALGGFVIAYALYQFVSLPAWRASRFAATYCGALGGLMGALFNSGGPFYVMYFSRRLLDKTTFRATFAANYLIDGGMRLAAYALLGLFHTDTLLSLAAALPVAAAGLVLGGRVHTGLSQRVFVRFISLLLVASGAALLMRH